MKDPQAKYGDVENKVLIIQKAFHPNLFWHLNIWTCFKDNLK